MIRFVTEDRSDSPFVKLFNMAYSPTDSVLYCAGSNTRLYSKVVDLLGSGNWVVVYLDLVPDNDELHGYYEKLLDLYVHCEKVVVVPIVCAEYLFILSVLDNDMAFYSRDGLGIILDKFLTYRPLVSGSSGVSRSFEKYCKSFCARRLNSDCCSVVSNKSGISQPYFAEACGVLNSCSGCKSKLTLREKGELFCSMYPVIPDIGESSSVCLSFDDLVEISSRLADELVRS